MGAAVGATVGDRVVVGNVGVGVTLVLVGITAGVFVLSGVWLLLLSAAGDGVLILVVVSLLLLFVAAFLFGSCSFHLASFLLRLPL